MFLYITIADLTFPFFSDFIHGGRGISYKRGRDTRRLTYRGTRRNTKLCIFLIRFIHTIHLSVFKHGLF